MSKKSPTKEIKLLNIEEVDFNLPEKQSPAKDKENQKEKPKLNFRQRLLEQEKQQENEKEKPKNNRIKR